MLKNIVEDPANQYPYAQWRIDQRTQPKATGPQQGDQLYWYETEGNAQVQRVRVS